MLVFGFWDHKIVFFFFFATHKGNNFYFHETIFWKKKCMWYIYEWRKDGRWTFVELEENGSVQIERNRNPKTSEKKMNEISRKLHAQILFWELNNKNALRWAFYCINDNKEIHLICFQIMHCILCHNSNEFKSKNSSYKSVNHKQHN